MVVYDLISHSFYILFDLFFTFCRGQSDRDLLFLQNVQYMDVTTSSEFDICRPPPGSSANPYMYSMYLKGAKIRFLVS
jgi:hypothetical protein